MALSSTRKVKPELTRYEAMTEGNEDVFDFFLSVLKIQNKAFRDSSLAFRGKTGVLDKRLEAGERLVRPDEVSIPRSAYIKCLREIEKEIQKRWTPGKKPGSVSGLEELGSKGFSGFINGMMSGKPSYLRGLPTKTKMKKETLQFTLESAATPFMARLSADVLKKVDISGWDQGRCPICGRLPVFAKFRKDDGARALYCGFCTTEWTFPRVRCVNCGNTNQSSMRYFYNEEDKNHRVDVCDVCKISIRTTDERGLERDVLFEVENWVTSYLNDAAKQEGYRPVG